MFLNKNRLILKSILYFSIIALIIAYFVEYILGHKPCNLCLIERYPYMGAILLILCFLYFNKFEKQILISILFFFIIGTLVSIYHVGIEKGLFEESFVCNIDKGINAQSKEDLLKQLEKKGPISCKDVTFSLFGLSLATLNTIISFFLSVIMLKTLKNYVKN